MRGVNGTARYVTDVYRCMKQPRSRARTAVPPTTVSFLSLPRVPGGRRARRRTEPADPESVGFVRRRQTVLGPGVQLRHHRHAAESRSAAAAAVIVINVTRCRRRNDAPSLFIVVVPLRRRRCRRRRHGRQVAPSRQRGSRHRRGRPTTVVQEIRIARVRRRQRRWRFGAGRCRIVQKADHRVVARHGQVVVVVIIIIVVKQRVVLFVRTLSAASQPTQVRNFADHTVRGDGITIIYYIFTIFIYIYAAVRVFTLRHYSNRAWDIL